MIILYLFSDQRPFKKYPWIVSIQAVMRICPNQEHCAKGELVKNNVKRHGLRAHDRWVSVVEFHKPTLGIGKVFGQESTVVKWNYQILSLHLVTVCQKVPILDFQSEFSMSKIIRIFLGKNSLKNINLGAPFL